MTVTSGSTHMISTSFKVKCKSRKYRMPEMTCVQNTINCGYWVKNEKKNSWKRKSDLRLYYQLNTSSGFITPSLLRSQCSKEVWDWSSSIEWWYTSLFSSFPFSAKWRRRVVSVSLKKPGISGNTEERICSYSRTFASQRTRFFRSSKRILPNAGYTQSSYLTW